MTTTAVLGAGAWGTALAIALTNNNHATLLWTRNNDTLKQINQTHRHASLPGVILPISLQASHDLTDVSRASVIYLALPSHAILPVCEQIADQLQPEQGLCLSSKGLSADNRFLTDCIQQLCPQQALAIVSGPSFARELAASKITALTVASQNKAFAEQIAQQLASPSVRLQFSEDMIGIQLANTVKNILAIAAGICDGLELGANARAALITQGLKEMQRLNLALGGQTDTLLGPAGLGDLVLTCSDNQSRNRQLGLKLAQGLSQRQALAELGQVVEGIKNSKVIWALSQDYKIDMPITEQVYRILYQACPIDKALQDLLA